MERPKKSIQAVILAAGRGTRMKHLTEVLPKPMLSVAGKNLLQHKIDILPKEITEVILVVGYLGETIRSFFGDEYGGRKITYVWMDTLNGTGKALWRVKDLIRGTFLVMMGDDLYSANDVEKMLAHKWAVLVDKVPLLMRGGRVVLDGGGHLVDIIEGQGHDVVDGLVNTGMYVLQPEIFNYELVKLEGREEWGLPQTLISAARNVSVAVVESTFWLQMTDPDDVVYAEKVFGKASV